MLAYESLANNNSGLREHVCTHVLTTTHGARADRRELSYANTGMFRVTVALESVVYVWAELVHFPAHHHMQVFCKSWFRLCMTEAFHSDRRS